MLEVKIEFNTNFINQNSKVSSKNSEDTQNSFFKVLDEAQKSFDASKEAIENSDNKKTGFFDKLKEKISQKTEKDDDIHSAEKDKNEKDIDENDITKQENEPIVDKDSQNESETSKNGEITQNEIDGEANQVVLNEAYDSEFQNEFDIQEDANTNNQELHLHKKTSHKGLLTNDSDVNAKENFENNLELQEFSKNDTEAADTYDANIENIKNETVDLNVQKDVNTLKNAAVQISQSVSQKLSDLNQVLSSKAGGENSALSEIIDKLNVKITSVIDSQTTENSASDENSTFDFNSSSFSNLESHLTKLALNKDSISFDKVMSQKNAQMENILNQIKENTQPLVKGTSQVSIVLRPESLGRLNINLISSNGALTAQITAQSQQTADLLNKSLETLRQNLIEQGVKVADVNIKVQESSNSENSFDNKNASSEQSNEFLEQNMSKNSQGTEKKPHLTKHLSSNMNDEIETGAEIAQAEDDGIQEIKHDGLIDYRI